MFHANLETGARAPCFRGKAQRKEREEAAGNFQPEDVSGFHHGAGNGFAEPSHAFSGGAAHFARVTTRFLRNWRGLRLRTTLLRPLLCHAAQHLHSGAQLAACAFVIHAPRVSLAARLNTNFSFAVTCSVQVYDEFLSREWLKFLPEQPYG